MRSSPAGSERTSQVDRDGTDPDNNEDGAFGRDRSRGGDPPRPEHRPDDRQSGPDDSDERDVPDSEPFLDEQVPSSAMGTKAERRQARERVAAYHEACLGQLAAHVANVLDGYRAGELDAYAVDETIHHYHRAAGQLWKFCWASGSSTHLELIARLIDEQTANRPRRLASR